MCLRQTFQSIVQILRYYYSISTVISTLVDGFDGPEYTVCMHVQMQWGTTSIREVEPFIPLITSKPSARHWCHSVRSGRLFKSKREDNSAVFRPEEERNLTYGIFEVILHITTLQFVKEKNHAGSFPMPIES